MSPTGFYIQFTMFLHNILTSLPLSHFTMRYAHKGTGLKFIEILLLCNISIETLILNSVIQDDHLHGSYKHVHSVLGKSHAFRMVEEKDKSRYMSTLNWNRQMSLSSGLCMFSLNVCDRQTQLFGSHIFLGRRKILLHS